MSPVDEALLTALLEGTQVPFQCPVQVGGVTMSRAMARAMERQLLRARMAERRTGSLGMAAVA